MQDKHRNNKPSGGFKLGSLLGFRATEELRRRAHKAEAQRRREKEQHNKRPKHMKHAHRGMPEAAQTGPLLPLGMQVKDPFVGGRRIPG